MLDHLKGYDVEAHTHIGVCYLNGQWDKIIRSSLFLIVATCGQLA